MDLFWIIAGFVLLLITRGLIALCDRTRDHT